MPGGHAGRSLSRRDEPGRRAPSPVHGLRAPPRTTICHVRRAHRQSTRLLGALLCLLGVAMAISALARGGGPLSLGVVLGVPLAVLGAGRVLLAREPDPGT